MHYLQLSCSSERFTLVGDSVHVYRANESSRSAYMHHVFGGRLFFDRYTVWLQRQRV